MRSRFLSSLVLALAVILTACGGDRSSTQLPAPTLYAAHNDVRTPFNLVSIPRLTEHEFDGRDLRVEEVLFSGLAFTRYQISYLSGDLRISGIMNVPNRAGPHPAIVTAHGYHDPRGYRVGAGLIREQAYLASRGYVVLHPDYRNYAQSEREGSAIVAHPLGYPEDLVNAVRALEDAGLPSVDPERIGLLGRSMGGGVALNALVAVPDLVDVVLLYSPVSSSALDNFTWFVPDEGETADLHEQVVDAYGEATNEKAAWVEASARSYLHRIEVPVEIHHGTQDPVTPYAWSSATVAALEAQGKDVRLVSYPGERHRFDGQWPTFIERAGDFFDAHLG